MPTIITNTISSRKVENKSKPLSTKYIIFNIYINIQMNKDNILKST